MKIHLLHDLAQVFSIEWDSKALEQRLNSPPQLHEEKAKHDPLNDHDDHKNNDVAVPKIDDLLTGGKQRWKRLRRTSKGNERDTLSQERKGISDAYWRLQSSTDDETTTHNSSLDGHKSRSSSVGSVSEDETEIKMPFSCKLVPPPYAKEKLNKGESNLNKTTESETLPEKGSNHGRAEGLPVEQNMLLCYELVAKFASFILGHVHELCKQRDCSDECKEAIQSLIYAAARFFYLPELRELRTLFTVIDISKEFVENLRQDPALKEMKIQLLHDLAQEFSVELDNKALEQRLNSQPQLHDENPKHDPENDHDDVKWHKNNDDPPPPDDYSQKAKQHQQAKLTDKGAAWDDEEEGYCMSS